MSILRVANILLPEIILKVYEVWISNHHMPHQRLCQILLLSLDLHYFALKVTKPPINPKRAGKKFALKLCDFFPSSLALILRPFL